MNSPAWFEIRVAEAPEPHWAQWFPDLERVADPTGTGTLLRGRLPDQPALFGLLARIRDLNLSLIEVRCLPGDCPDRPQSPSTGDTHDQNR